MSLCSGYLPNTNLAVDTFTTPPLPVVSSSSSSSSSSFLPYYYFLSHYHTDHIPSLSATFSSPLYTSRVTRHFLLADYPSLNVQALDLEVVYHIDNFSVILFDANHCAGSVMFLFTSSSFGCILHTGDFRYDPLYFHSSLLHSRIGSIDICYMDMTFAHPHSARFPPKHFSIQETIQLIKKYFKKYCNQEQRHIISDETTPAPGISKNNKIDSWPESGVRVYLAADGLGGEELLLSVAIYFHIPLYAPNINHLKMLKQTRSILANESTSTPLHVTASKSFQQFASADKRERLESWKAGLPHHVPALYIKPSTMWYLHNSKSTQTHLTHMQPILERKQINSTQNYQSSSAIDSSLPGNNDLDSSDASEDDDDNDYYDEDERVVLHSENVRYKNGPSLELDHYGVYHLLYSMHSDLCEIMEFISLMQPNIVIPINTPALHQHTASQDPYINSKISKGEQEDETIRQLQLYLNTLLPRNRVQVLLAKQMTKSIAIKTREIEPDSKKIKLATEDETFQSNSNLLAPSSIALHPPATNQINEIDGVQRSLDSISRPAEDDSILNLSNITLPIILRSASLPLDHRMEIQLPIDRNRRHARQNKKQTQTITKLHLNSLSLSSSSSSSSLLCRKVPVNVFDFSEFPRTIVYLEQDIRGSDRSNLSARLELLGARVSDNLTPSVSLVLMSYSRASSLVLFPRLINRLVRMARDEYKKIAQLEFKVKKVFVYKKNVVDQLESLWKKHQQSQQNGRNFRAASLDILAHLRFIDEVKSASEGLLREFFIVASDQINEAKVQQILEEDQHLHLLHKK